MKKRERIVLLLKRNWMYAFLISVAVLTLSGMIAYQYMRQDPVVVTIKDAKGFKTTQVVHKTPNETVGEVVDKVSSSTDGYSCSYDLNQRIHSISDLNLSASIPGTIHVDNKTINFETSALTVGEVLEENDIQVSPIDIVNPSTNTLITKGNSDITVDRVASSSEMKSEVLPFLTETRQNDNAPYNSTKVLQRGQNGLRSYTEEVVYSQGQEVERHVTGEERVEPVNEVVEIGTNLTVGKPNIQRGDIQAWRPYVIKALEENKLEPTEDRINRILKQIETESDGDQNAEQQIVDMNTIVGQNAKGLLQTIPSTFEDYHFEGYDDIYNGYHNLLAAINYAKERYGDDLVGMGRGIGF